MFCTSKNQMQMLTDYFRERDEAGEGVYLAQMQDDLPMSPKTCWKVLQSMLEEGLVSKSEAIGPPPHNRHRFEYWMHQVDMMTQEERDQMGEMLKTILEEVRKPRITLVLDGDGADGLTLSVSKKRKMETKGLE